MIKHKILNVAVLVASLSSTTVFAAGEIGKLTPKDLSTPNKVETSIGTLEFLDGAPLPETAKKAYDYLDTMRGVDTFIKGMPGASIQALMDGPKSIGAIEYNQVTIFDKLLN